jgi:predicted nucleic-acid-binding Zn-ribbon protein
MCCLCQGRREIKNGTCPKCGHSNFSHPKDNSDDSLVQCMKCGQKEPVWRMILTAETAWKKEQLEKLHLEPKKFQRRAAAAAAVFDAILKRGRRLRPHQIMEPDTA